MVRAHPPTYFGSGCYDGSVQRNKVAFDFQVRTFKNRGVRDVCGACAVCEGIRCPTRDGERLKPVLDLVLESSQAAFFPGLVSQARSGAPEVLIWQENIAYCALFKRSLVSQGLSFLHKAPGFHYYIRYQPIICK